MAHACQQGLQQLVFGLQRLLEWLGFQVCKRPALLGARLACMPLCPTLVFHGHGNAAVLHYFRW